VQVVIWVLEEWAWNVYPSTQASSLVVVGVYVAVLGGVWRNWGGEVEQSSKRTK
jgi:alpha-1,3-mannosyltransferase